MNIRVAISIILILAASLTLASDTDITVDDFAFIAGQWRAEAFGGTCDEVWTPPLGNSMEGMFRLVADGQVVFYELIVIAHDSTGWAMKLKHFNADMTGWEEKDKVVTFPLVASGQGEAAFEGITYRLKAADTLQVVLISEHDGTPDTTEFLFHRVK